MARSKYGQMTRTALVLAWLWAGGSGAQIANMSQQDEKGPDFHFDIMGTALEPLSTTSRLNIYLEIVHDDLQFIKSGNRFEAGYEVTVVIYDHDNEQVDGTIWKESVQADNYDATNTRHQFHQSHRSFELDPGKYKLIISVMDLETRQSTERKKNFTLSDYAASSLGMSDIVFISQIEVDSNRVHSIRPQVSDAQKGVVDSSMVYFEVYQTDSSTTARTEYELFAVNAKKQIRRSFSHELSGWRNPVYFVLRADSLAHDLYRLKITTRIGEQKVAKEKEFYVRWSALPSTAADLHTAIEQLRYIASKDEWKLLKKAKGDAQLAEFKSFWNRHDPTPGTEANELRDAYYTRIEFANNTFSQMQRPGWRTDMGIVYIILGQPDDIERNAYPRYSKPYEIWSYYRYSRQFLFYDVTGFGDYRLETPMSIYEFQRLLTN